MEYLTEQRTREVLWIVGPLGKLTSSSSLTRNCKVQDCTLQQSQRHDVGRSTEYLTSSSHNIGSHFKVRSLDTMRKKVFHALDIEMEAP